MEKRSGEILSLIHSELQDLIERASELDRRLSELLPDEPADEEPEAEASPAFVPGTAEPQGFSPIDILMDDEDVSFVVPNRQEEFGVPASFNIEPLEDDELIAASPAATASLVKSTSQVKGTSPAKAGKLETARKVEKSEKAERAEKKDKPSKSFRLAAKSAGKTAPKQPKHEPLMFYAWQTASPASPLSNIISVISLKERSLFINVLFKEDAQKFIDTINAFNAMGSLSEAEKHIRKHFPEWKMDSDVVFRLMMAIRRKLN